MANEEKRPSAFWESFKTVIYAVLIALVVRSLAYEPFHIPSGSMKSTLLIGDYLFVSKFSYGYSKYSFPYPLPGLEGRVWNSKPERGDIVVFKLPRDNTTDYIKRLVGLPGDRIQVQGGILLINDEPVPRQRIEDFDLMGRNGYSRKVPQYIETLPNGVSYHVLDSDPFGALDNTDVYVVPEDHFFFMGDNRDHSSDSRVLNNVGYVPVENLIGRAEILFFSTDGTSRFWEVWKWPFATRFTRFFTTL
jgi:signal peptidase I